MRSAGPFSDDLTERARSRDAAVELIGRDGFDSLTVRMVAERARVSPGLVIHYFGSKHGLRAECEHFVGDRIHEAIEKASADGHGLYATSQIADQYHNELQRNDTDAHGGSSSWRPHRTEPNAPAGDPPSLENNQLGPPSQPAA
jgi:AcrR family transcriptional regulator